MTPSVDRDALIGAHLRLARAIARSVNRSRPNPAQLADLESEAYLGLTQAARAFDPSRGAQFKTFASARIRGQVLDYLRRMAPLSRVEHLAAVAPVRLVAIEAAGQVPAVRGSGAEIEERAISRALIEKLLTRAALSARERFTLQRYYFADESLRSIARELRVNESRACQIKFRAVEKLRDSARKLERR